MFVLDDPALRALTEDNFVAASHFLQHLMLPAMLVSVQRGSPSSFVACFCSYVCFCLTAKGHVAITASRVHIFVVAIYFACIPDLRSGAVEPGGLCVVSQFMLVALCANTSLHAPGCFLEIGGFNNKSMVVWETSIICFPATPNITPSAAPFPNPSTITVHVALKKCSQIGTTERKLDVHETAGPEQNIRSDISESSFHEGQHHHRCYCYIFRLAQGSSIPCKVFVD